MARLEGPSWRFMELLPLRYQFGHPDPVAAASADVWDANWLVVRLIARDGNREWTSDDPAFLTWELLDLAAWFQDLADRSSHDLIEFDGTEPNLHFTAEGSGDLTCLRAFFELEYRPENIRWKIPFGELFVEFVPGAEALRRFGKDLRSQLEEFPQRGSIPQGASA